MASRWWGKIFTEENKEGAMVELDVVAESIDRKHILIGECKWTNKEDAQRLVNSLEAKIKYLPFIKKGQSVHIMLFLKNEPHNKDAARIIYPSDIVKTE
ncbi:DUF234 domain-containing protein [Ruminococcus bicirculans (ex Wegman et al. 2014)]|jgi:hypothetical protein|nr:DUF234 domain-containing protein [Ruminococcus bicirculans (ex Wegman et al. 2014)]